MTLIKNGTEITCTPNVDLSQAERDSYAKALLKRMQREHPDVLSNIIEEERQERQELHLEMDKLKEAPTLHMASSALYNNDQGTKRLSPSELRRIARSAEYHQAFTNYHMNIHE